MRKKSGGPNTELGKFKVSQNAIKHSLSTSKVVDVTEKNNIDAYAQSLISHYDTKDPLEVLQLQRIALYREKLAKAYQAESAQEKLAQQDLQNNPKLVFEKMTFVSPVAKGMATEYIRWKEWILPYNMDHEELKQICREIKEVKNPIQSKAEFTRYFPCLSNYLDQFESSSIKQNQPIAEKLEFFSKRLKNIFTEGEQYTEKARHILELLEKFKEEKLALQQQATPDEESDLDKLMREQEEKRRAERLRRNPSGISAAKENKNLEPSFPDAKLFREQLQTFVDLQKYFLEAQDAYAQFDETRTWMMQTIGMQAGQSDVLLRYQTTWERRLSAAIGELLELQKRSKISN